MGYDLDCGPRLRSNVEPRPDDPAVSVLKSSVHLVAQRMHGTLGGPDWDKDVNALRRDLDEMESFIKAIHTLTK